MSLCTAPVGSGYVPGDSLHLPADHPKPSLHLGTLNGVRHLQSASWIDNYVWDWSQPPDEDGFVCCPHVGLSRSLLGSDVLNIWDNDEEPILTDTNNPGHLVRPASVSLSAGERLPCSYLLEL